METGKEEEEPPGARTIAHATRGRRGGRGKGWEEEGRNHPARVQMDTQHGGEEEGEKERGGEGREALH